MEHDPELNADSDDQDAPADTERTVAVTVVRTGGIAGMRRRWGVEAADADADPWIALVDACPWDACVAAPHATTGADRFAYSVSARMPKAEHHAELAESEASGPWRTLIDAVRDASTPSPR
ncbi:protealysin inhibitor emfourin [Microbacterium sp. bgisy203]|uniref:protealysin inhibitor emfourin n=1 Tax=Microbacterium sp. bgisy203 TaxID=3413799 RepID=UPI003D75A353